MAKNLSEWLQEGQQLYDTAIEEYRALEEQAQDIQEKLAAKRLEVNQIAKVVNKPSVDDSRSAAGNGVDVVDPSAPGSTPFTRNSIARALTGQPLRR